jgi:site-specific recombinase XerD
VRPGNLVQEYVAHLQQRGAQQPTVATSKVALARFLAHLRRERVGDVRSVREEHVVSFRYRLATRRSERTRRPLAVSTQALYLSSVHTFFAWLEAQHRLLANPARGVTLPRVERLPRALSEAQARRLVGAPDAWTIQGQRDRALLELLYGTGLRLAECVRLDLQDLDLEAGILLVRDGKGRKDRYVPLSGAAAKAVDRYLREARPILEQTRWPSGGALFLSKYGRRLGGMSVRTVVRAWGEASDVRASTHVLRHSYATHLLQGGANVREIQSLLGHKDLGTTALYMKVDTRGLRAMLDRCHPRQKS